MGFHGLFRIVKVFFVVVFVFMAYVTLYGIFKNTFNSIDTEQTEHYNDETSRSNRFWSSPVRIQTGEATWRGSSKGLHNSSSDKSQTKQAQTKVVKSSRVKTVSTADSFDDQNQKLYA